jgi:hypothetical protein
MGEPGNRNGSVKCRNLCASASLRLCVKWVLVAAPLRQVLRVFRGQKIGFRRDKIVATCADFSGKSGESVSSFVF